jgi:hypothetical protein
MLNCGDQFGCSARAGADLAHDPPVLQLGVDPFTGAALAGVGGVDLLLGS